MKQLLKLLFLFPLVAMCQEKGIQFNQNLSWKDLQVKARKENKYIFVDCYTTWCGPCKTMDKSVYPLDMVGDTMNKYFVCAKFQMDTTNQDNDTVKQRYGDAGNIKKRFDINAYPALLFFSPDGTIVHRALGLKSPREFIAIADDAINPERQYYTLLHNYDEVKKNLSVISHIINIATSLHDTAIISKIGKDYTDNYLLHLSDSELFTKENIRLLQQFTRSSKDPGFQFFYYNQDRVDNVTYQGYASAIIDRIITYEEINPVLSKDTIGVRPNWRLMALRISKKYNKEYAGRTISIAKCNWYKLIQDWPNYTESLVSAIEKHTSDTDKDNGYYINYFAWDVFYYGRKRTDLRAAEKWMRRIMQKGPGISNYIDTYANLLYKLGDIKQALYWEQKAVGAAIKEKNDQSTHDCTEALNKMKNRIPTWPIKS